jgi:hypothetical protein
MRRLALACMALVFVAGAAAIARMADKPRDAMTAVATPPPLRQMEPVTLEPGQRACQDQVALEDDTRTVRFYSGSPTPDVPQLRVSVRGPGYRAERLSPAGEVAGGGADGIYDIQIPRPSRSLIATVCVASASRTQAALLAGSLEDRVHSRSTTEVDGRPLKTRLGLVLLSGGPRSVASHPKQVLQRAATFQPPFVGWFLLALLGLAVVVAVPAAAVFAILRALRDDGVAG